MFKPRGQVVKTGQRELHNEASQNFVLYCMLLVKKSLLTRHVDLMGETTDPYKIVVETSGGKRPS